MKQKPVLRQGSDQFKSLKQKSQRTGGEKVIYMRKTQLTGHKAIA